MSEIMNEKQKQFEIMLSSVRTLEFSFTQLAVNYKKNYQFQLSFRFNYTDNNNNLIFTLRLKFKTKDEDELGQLITENIFKIKNSGISFKDNELKIPDQILNIILSVSYSTARGILIEKGSNTIFGKKLLPLRSFIPENMEVSEQE